MLKQTLTNLLIYRHRMGMPSFIPEAHHWLKETIHKTCKTNSWQKIKYQLENLCVTENALNNTDFKRKQISDDEMIAFHKEFIENEIQIIDNEIIHINRQIKKLMENKLYNVNI